MMLASSIEGCTAFQIDANRWVQSQAEASQPAASAGADVEMAAEGADAEMATANAHLQTPLDPSLEFDAGLPAAEVRGGLT